MLVALVASSEQQLTLVSLGGVQQDFNGRMLQAHISITPSGKADVNSSSDDTVYRDPPTSAMLKVLQLATTLISFRKTIWNWKKNPNYNSIYLSRPWLKSFMAGRPAVLRDVVNYFICRGFHMEIQ